MFRASSDTAVTRRVRPTTENPSVEARSRASLRARAMSSSTRIGITAEGVGARGAAGDERTDGGSGDRVDGGDRTDAGSVERAEDGGADRTDAGSAERPDGGPGERAARSAWIAAQHSSTRVGSRTNSRRLRSI